MSQPTLALRQCDRASLKAQCARHRGESAVLFKNGHAAQARARWHVRSGHAGLGRRTKNIWFFKGKHEKAHRAQERAHFSKCAPRSGESSILPTQDGAHDHVSKQNEHRAEAGAPFSIKMCTMRRREAQKCSSGAAKVLQLQRRTPYKSYFGPA